jgi:hypothetical protein
MFLWGMAMLKILERNIALVEERLVILAPPQAKIPDTFKNVLVDTNEHQHLVREMQSLRATVYLSEGNVKPSQLSIDGRHQTPEDENSWHLLLRDADGQVSSCAWYLEHENSTSFEHLRVQKSPLAQAAEWGEKLKGAVESELARARRDGLRYAEVGGWAVSRERRCSCECVLLAFAAYSLCRTLGGALVMTTANVTHGSSSILRRIGGSYLEFQGEAMPAYFDARYNTNIELLRFDSRQPNPKYLGFIEIVKSRLANISVVAHPSQSTIGRTSWLDPVVLPTSRRGARQPLAAA